MNPYRKPAPMEPQISFPKTIETKMDNTPKTPDKPGMQYKVITVSWSENEDWVEQLELKLERLSRDGWRPILYADGGKTNTVILERPNQG